MINWLFLLVFDCSKGGRSGLSCVFIVATPYMAEYNKLNESSLWMIIRIVEPKMKFTMKRSVCFGLLGALLLSMVAVSCNVPMNKDSYVKGFESFVAEVEANGANYTLNDWEKADERYENFTDDYYERFAGKLTPEDQNALGRCAARYGKVRMASARQGMSDDIEDGINFMEGYLEEAGDDMIDEVNQMIQQMEEVSWDD